MPRPNIDILDKYTYFNGNFSKTNPFILMKILDKFKHVLKIKGIYVKKWAMYF